MLDKKLVLVLFLLFLASFVYAAENPVQVSSFAPQGTVKQVRQVRAVFSAPMVSFGDPKSARNPFTIESTEPGNGRWTDPQNWVYDFKRDLPAGIRCSFQLVSGLCALDGRPLSGKRRFLFSTGGPAVTAATPSDGSNAVAEDQIFILNLDTHPDEATVLANAGFAIPGIRQRVDIQIIKDEKRDAILKTSPWLLREEPDPGKLLLIQCRQRFPEGAKVSLIWGKGIKSASGIATEKNQVLHFKTREAFFAEFHCDRENPQSGCIPVLPLRITFNAPIDSSQNGEAVLKGPEGKIWKSVLSDSEGEVRFNGPFPENADFEMDIPADLKDDAGRPLSNAASFPLRFRTGNYPVLAKFAARFGILELNAEPSLPLTVRNIESEIKARMMKIDPAGSGPAGRITGKSLNISPDHLEDIQPWLRKVAMAKRETSLFEAEKESHEFTIPRTNGEKAFEVVGIPLTKPGLYIVELESAILGKSLLDSSRPMYVPTAALVTNISVHFKQGRESSMAWVTSLDRGEPVPRAEVTVMDCNGRTLWKGLTDGDGIARIEEALPAIDTLPRCPYELADFDYSQMGALRRLGEGLLVTARSGDDLSFVHSSWDEGIEAWRFNLPSALDLGTVTAHTIFDRTLLRAGETLNMKHIIRDHSMNGFSATARNNLPNTVFISHYGSGQVCRMPLTWDASGVAETSWTTPRDTKLGGYSVTLGDSRDEHVEQKGNTADSSDRTTEDTSSRSWISGEFRVEEFRIPILKGAIEPASGALINSRTATLDLGVQYLAGGGAGLLPVKLRTETGTMTLPAFEGFDDVVFANGGIKEGLFHRGATEEEGDEPGDDINKNQRQLLNLSLDATGSARTVISNLPASDKPQEMTTEMEFRDPSGEIQTVSRRISLWNSGRLIGIRSGNWVISRDSLKFQTAVVDISGKPVAGAPVKVDMYQRNVLSHRKRLVGGFYGYDHTVEVKRIATVFEGKTDASGFLFCECRPPVSGEVILVAESRDENGNRTVANQSVWIAGKDEWQFEGTDNDRMDVLPANKRYEPGETAVFQVRMPFREATALITVEREGVMDSWIRKLSDREPVIEVPIQGNYAPNVFVSVLAVRGRVADVQPTAMVDLGKPTFRIGIAEIRVGWKSHELNVSVTADRKTYHVRETANVSIRVATADGKAPPTGTEVAVAAVDEGLLELMPNKSWEVLPAMMGRRGYEVQTSTAQMQVVGKRHFGLKALARGGGGGRQTTRELYDTLLLWKGRLLLNDKGEASIDIPLNDSISSFRIVAIATGGTGLFGTGQTSIQSTRDLVVFSGLSPMVREGDRYRAGITVRNTSQRAMTVDISAHANGTTVLPDLQTVSLSPGEAQEVGWDMTVHPATDAISWEIDAAEHGGDRDRVRVQQQVLPAVPLRVIQSDLFQIEKKITVPVEKPAGAIPGGGIRLSIRPTLGDGLNAVVDYMKQYPYGCMEQKVSVAVALRDASLRDRWMKDISSYMDENGLIKYFPATSSGDPVLTAYIIAVNHEAGWDLPEAVIRQCVPGLVKFVEGTIVRGSLTGAPDLTLRKLSAIEALFRIRKAEPRLLDSIVIDPNLWPTSAVIDWMNILLNMEQAPNRARRLAEAEQVLKSRLTYTGSTLGFSTERSDNLWWLMGSNDTNAVRLILTALRLEGWQPDLPQLVRGALGRQIQGHWDLTTANAWGVLAMEKFSRKFQNEAISGSSQVTLADQSHVFDWAALPKGDTAVLPWPSATSMLTADHHGSGKPWLTLQSLAAVPLQGSFESGYAIRKTIIPIERKVSGKWSIGDILRIKLEIQAQSDRTWVAVTDPIPAGAAILGSGLGRDSQILTQGEPDQEHVWPAYTERTFAAFLTYYEYVPKGSWTVEYTLRLNQSGIFNLPPTGIEALYAPEVRADLSNAVWEIEP